MCYIKYRYSFAAKSLKLKLYRIMKEEDTMRKKAKAKKVLSLLAAAAMFTSVFAETASAFENETLFSAGSSVETYGDSADEAADSIVIYDEFGTNISNGKDAYIYLDNSPNGRGKTSTSIKVEVKRNGQAVNDPIYYVKENLGKNNEKVEVTTQSSTRNTLTLNLSSYVSDGGKMVSLRSGTTYIEFSTKSGEVYRKLYVVVYDPTNTVSVSNKGAAGSFELEFEKYGYESIASGKKVLFSFGNKGTYKDQNEAVEAATAYFNQYIGPADYISYLSTISNHKYQLNAKLGGTDKAQWKVFEGPYHKGIETDGTPSVNAEITKEGLFTPKNNGTVTIMVKANPTIPYMSEDTYAEGATTGSYETNNAYTESFRRDESWNDAAKSKVLLYNTDSEKEVSATTGEYSDKVMPRFIQVSIIKENPAKALRFNNPPKGLQMNEENQLDLEMTPTYTGSEYTGATDVIRWVSSNTKVATVDSKGLVKAIGKGEVTITAYAENENVSASCNIRVYTKASSVTISPSPASTRKGIPITLKATLSPDTAEDLIVWSSSDDRIATVTPSKGQFGDLVQEAVVKGGSQTGTVTITAKAVYSGVAATCTVTVNDTIDAASIDLSFTDDNALIQPIEDGQEITIYMQTTSLKPQINVRAALTAADGTEPDDDVIWTVEDNEGDYISLNDVMKDKSSEVDSKQKIIKGMSIGTAKVTASSQADPSLKKTFYISVIRPCDSITLTNTGYSGSVRKNEGVLLTATLKGPDGYTTSHSDRVKSWTSNKPDIAEVNDNGYVFFRGNGSVTITCTTVSGKKQTISLTGYIPSEVVFTGSGTSYIPPTVENPVLTGIIKLAPTTSGGVTTLTGSLTVPFKVNGTVGGSPATISSPEMTWISSDEEIATVDNKGKVTGIATGKCQITAICGSKSATLDIIVCGDGTKATVLPSSVVAYYNPLYKNSVPYVPSYTVMLGDLELTEGVDYDVEYTNNVLPEGQKLPYNNIASMNITFKGNHTGTKTQKFNIVQKPISAEDVEIAPVKKQQATGAYITPELDITYMGVKLVKDVDYTVTSYSRYLGPATATVTGKGNYNGTRTVEFEIICSHPHDQLDIRATQQPTCTEDGKGTVRCKLCNYVTDVIPATGHSYEKKVVKPGYGTKGYTLHTCTVCGHSYKDNYMDALPQTDLSKCKISMKYSSFTYTGKALDLSSYITVKDPSGNTLVKGTDYTLSYKNNVKVGYKTGSVTITGKKKFKGSVTKTFTIKPVKLAAPTLSTKNGTVTVNWKKVTSDALAYQVIYDKVSDFDSSNHSANYHTTTIKDLNTLTKTISSNIKPGETWYFKVRAFITSNGKVDGTRYGNFSAATKIVVKNNLKTVSIPSSTYTYTGKAIKPAVTVKDVQGKKLTTSDYTVTYSNNTKAGKATIKITGKGKYQGTLTKTFIIKPVKETFSSLTTTAKNSITVKYSKASAGSTGYQVQYSTSSSFASGNKTVTVSGISTLTKKITSSANLKSGKTYYVRVRAYVTVSGTKYCGAWSTSKKIKVK